MSLLIFEKGRRRTDNGLLRGCQKRTRRCFISRKGLLTASVLFRRRLIWFTIVRVNTPLKVIGGSSGMMKRSESSGRSRTLYFPKKTLPFQNSPRLRTILNTRRNVIGKVLITGAEGQLGTEFIRVLSEQKFLLSPLKRQHLMSPILRRYL